MKYSPDSAWVNKMINKHYVDSHAHIMAEEYGEDFEEMLLRTKQEGVDRILIILTQYAEEYTGDDFGSTKVFYDKDSGIVTGTATKSTAQGSLTRVLTLSLTISDIGTTDIDFPSK